MTRAVIALLAATSLVSIRLAGQDTLAFGASAATIHSWPSTSASATFPADAPTPFTAPHAIDARLVVASQSALQLAAATDDATPQAQRRRGRYGAGLIGFGVGALAGVGVAAAFGPYDNCACDDPGLDQALIGIAVGGLLGAGIGAALPGSDVAGCSRGQRMGPGIFGSLLGSAVFGGIGALVDPTVAIFAIPFGAPLGAKLALRHCR